MHKTRKATSDTGKKCRSQDDEAFTHFPVFNSTFDISN